MVYGQAENGSILSVPLASHDSINLKGKDGGHGSSEKMRKGEVSRERMEGRKEEKSRDEVEKELVAFLQTAFSSVPPLISLLSTLLSFCLDTSHLFCLFSLSVGVRKPERIRQAFSQLLALSRLKQAWSLAVACNVRETRDLWVSLGRKVNWKWEARECSQPEGRREEGTGRNS